MNTQREYWTEYFERACRDGSDWVDYSNQRVYLQTIGAVLEVSDCLLGRRVLDIGCGRGQLSRLSQVLGASAVTGIDLAADALKILASSYPSIDWRAGDLTDPEFRSDLGTFGVIYALEVMQYLPVPETLDWLSSMLEPGGRFIGMFPYEGCPIVQRARDRFEGRYQPPSLQAITQWAAKSGDVATWALRGMRFQEDQRVAPYELLQWAQDPSWDVPPNRIQLIIQKK